MLNDDHYDANGCAASRDAGRDYECDRAAPGTLDDFEAANGASSRDTHPTTSCDRDCAPSPSPAAQSVAAPVLPRGRRETPMADGTWPAAPPPTPPPDASGVFWWGLALALALCSVAARADRRVRPRAAGLQPARPHVLVVPVPRPGVQRRGLARRRLAAVQPRRFAASTDPAAHRLGADLPKEENRRRGGRSANRWLI